MRVLVLSHSKRWQEALEWGKTLCTLAPSSPAGFIHVAFCLHELGKSAAARDMLLSAPAVIESEPTYHYNLACYECALGNLEEARKRLKRSFELDKKFREFAKTDPDLHPLRQ